MKFLCDRCKTRYAIADERVRGKILKIRCKNCSAVITVREGMDESGEPTALVAPPPPTGPDDGPPPDALQEEWYVSRDGNQEGPFALTEAQAWIAARLASEELFCWNEGFDDWLPVEKVSHFRGLRGASRARAATRPGAVSEPEPQPLFAATMAAIEAEVAADAAAAAAAAPPPGPVVSAGAAAIAQLPPPKNPAPSQWRAPTPVGGVAALDEARLVPRPATPPAGVPAAARRRTPPAGIPTAPRPATPAAGVPALPRAGTPAVGAPALPRAGTPAVGAPALPRAGTPAVGVPALPRAGTPAVGVPALPKAPPAPVAAAPRPPLPAPFALSRSATAPNPLAAPPPPSVAPAISPAAAPAVAAPAVVAPAVVAPARSAQPIAAARFDTGGAEAAPVDRDDDADRLPPPADPGFEDDLDIGEVSRVVRLADLGRAPFASAAKLRQPTAAVAAIGRGTGAVSSLPALAPGADPPPPAPDLGPSMTAVPIARRRPGLYVAIGLVAVVVSVVAVVALSGSNEDASGNETTGGTADYGDLGYRPFDPSGKRPGSNDPQVGSGTGSVRSIDRGSGRRPVGSQGSGSGTGTGAGPGTGSGPTEVPSNPNLAEMSGDDIFAMSARMESGTRRCYERAMKADPFLKVSKIKATIAVSAAGPVTSVTLSTMASTPLGICLTAAIKRWPFRPSKSGLVSEFALVFEQK